MKFFYLNIAQYVLIVKKGLLSVGGSIYLYYGCTARLPKWFDFWTLSSRSLEQSTSEQNHLWWMCPRRSTPIKRSPGIPYLFLVCYWNLKNTRRQGSYLFKSINSWLCPGMQLPLLCAMSAPCPLSAPVDSFRGRQWLINSIVFFQFPWLSDWYIREKRSALMCVLYSCIGIQ